MRRNTNCKVFVAALRLFHTSRKKYAFLSKITLCYCFVEYPANNHHLKMEREHGVLVLMVMEISIEWEWFAVIVTHSCCCRQKKLLQSYCIQQHLSLHSLFILSNLFMLLMLFQVASIILMVMLFGSEVLWQLSLLSFGI